jgi:hypothetical protein
MKQERPYERYTTTAIRMMHDGIGHHLKLEDGLISEGRPSPYGMRTYADHRQMSNELERELTARGQQFVTIMW